MVNNLPEPNELRTILDRIESKVDQALFDIDLLRRRNTTYFGENVALTHLFDDTPIYVNCFDFGPPANYINGGAFEQTTLDVLFSFLRDDTVFLDIGANLGFFSLLIGRRLTSDGRIHAFEPNPDIVKLLRASAYLNGFGGFEGKGGIICSHAIAAGDCTAMLEFAVPDNHAGGASQIGPGESFAGSRFSAVVQPLDDFFGADFSCDLVKIDVEGHELAALYGMRGILQRSPSVKVLFEKLERDRGDEPAFEAFFDNLAMRLFAIDDESCLHRIEPGALAIQSGNILAARSEMDLNGSSRRQFTIYSSQFKTVSKTLIDMNRKHLQAAGTEGEILFYGPYWYLAAGVYRVTFEGEVAGDLRLTLAARFGHAVSSTTLTGVNPSFDAVFDRNMLYFECVGFASGKRTGVDLREIRFERIA